MTPALVLVALVVVAGTLWCTSWVGPLALIGLSVAWIRVDHPVEGVILHTFEPGRGLTGADLAAVAAIVVAVARLMHLAWRARGRREARRHVA